MLAYPIYHLISNQNIKIFFENKKDIYGFGKKMMNEWLPWEKKIWRKCKNQTIWPKNNDFNLTLSNFMSMVWIPPLYISTFYLKKKKVNSIKLSSIMFYFPRIHLDILTFIFFITEFSKLTRKKYRKLKESIYFFQYQPFNIF